MGLNTQELINCLQRKVILHSYIYYELDESVISDHDYNQLTHRLVKYKNQYPDLWKNSEYYEQFGDEYDGSTGFDLFQKLSFAQQEVIELIAERRPKTK